jgi:regulatory protein
MNPEKALQKMMASCARKEQCSWDIREKLKKWDLTAESVNTIIARLEKESFIDNERFVKAYVKDKMQFNNWGKTKIRYQLQAKRISPELINAALLSINDEGYSEKLDDILEKKYKQLLPIEDKWQAKSKLIRFAASRGFEPDLIYQKVENLLKQT